MIANLFLTLMIFSICGLLVVNVRMQQRMKDRK